MNNHADINHHTIFRENRIGKWTPRSIFFDCESDTIDSLVYAGEGVGEILEPG